jgi:hypothetical protein
VTGTPVQFHLPIGIPLELDVREADVSNGALLITAHAAPDAWEYVEGGYLFHLDDAETDDGRPPMLDDGTPVEVVLRLDDDVAATLPASARKNDTFVGTLTTAPDDSPLLDTESWFLVEARQGTNGYRTTYADAPSLHRRDTDAPVLEPREHRESPLMDAVLSFLRSMDLDFERFDRNILRVPVASDNGTYNVFVTVRDEHHQITIHATWTEEVPEDRRPSVMELITRINIDLTVSWFELDLDHGSVSARSGVDLEGVAPSDVLVENAFYAAERTMDRFLPALHAVTFDGLDPGDVPPPAD